MGKFVVGEVVIFTFPFSDLSGTKLRPALVLAEAEFNDLILCQITSQSYFSKLSIELSSADFGRGSLPISSYIRPDKIFTTSPSIIDRVAGQLNVKKYNEVIMKVRQLFVML